MDYENLTPQYRIEEYLEAIVSGWVDATRVAYPEVPSWRIEEFLDAFVTYIWEDEDHPRKPCPEPVWRLEECLRAIYDVMTGAATPWPFPAPTSRIEEYLAAIHAYLADGTELPVPEPVWRIEQWLAYALDAVKQGGGVETTVSGTLVHITNALTKAALSVLASIEPTQDLHGYANPWPGGGGKNKIDKSTGLVFSTRFMVFGVANSSDTIPDGSFVLPAGEYTFSLSGDNSTNAEAISVYGADGTRIKIVYNNKVLKFTNPSSQALKLSITISSGNFQSWDNYDMQMESGSTETAWVPYENICPISGSTGLSVYVSPTQDPDDATVYNVDWTTQAGTVYHGTVDVVTGVLTVDRAYESFDGSSATGIGVYNPLSGFYFTLPGMSANYSADGLCNTDKTRTSYGTGGVIFGIGNNNYAYFTNLQTISGASTVSDLCSWLQSNNLVIEFVYPLATPITYQLTAQEVQMLLGENYVWSSSGDTVSVTYYAEGNANDLQALNILLGGRYSNPKTADDVSDKEALEIILGGNK